jgi:tetraacyldisaccharide 4'-kinase
MKPLPILLPFSYVYGAVVALRNMFFEKNFFRSTSVSVPVISVGNITSGGTGKTPIVELIASMLRALGRRPAIVSRGYGRLTKGYVLVSDGTTVHARPQDAGDEVFQMAKKLAGVVVIADERRAHAAQIAVGQLQADAIVLDDGFQHRALARDCDIVLIDAAHDPLSMPMLPAGHRREPLSGLRRADAVIITKCDAQTNAAALADRLRGFTDAPVFTSSYDPVSLIDCRSGASTPLSAMLHTPAVLFCGIAQPESFRRTAASLGIPIASFHAYGDHHRYAPVDLQDLARAGKTTGAEWYLTTEKDARRLDGMFDPAVPFYYLAMEAVVHDADAFSALLFSLVSHTE